MFQLFNPIALLAAAAVIIPVVIHLWNTHKGKTLKVGSIALISESSKKPARSIRITNWPLLLLRCLLLLLLSLLLAKPFWKNDGSKKKIGWMLVADYDLGNAYQQQNALIDSLIQNGYELRNLNPSREVITLQDTDFYQAKTNQSNINTWSYLKYLDAALPEKFSVYIFSDQLSQNFAGKRPVVRLDLHWVSLNRSISADTTPVSAYTNLAGESITMNRISTTQGNFYENAIVSNNPAKTNLADTIHIGIYAGTNTTDAKYLTAAIDAISAYTGRNIVINTSVSPEPQQVIFWLQDTEPDKKITSTLAAGGTILRYENSGPFLQINSPASSGTTVLDANDPDLFYKYASNSPGGTPLWTLANGDPLMTIESTGDMQVIHFKSRFNPQWTNIVWKESFARLLLPIILPAPKNNQTDLRRIATEQAKPGFATTKVNLHTDDLGFINRSDLSFPIWVFAFLVFAAERIFAYRQNRQKNV